MSFHTGYLRRKINSYKYDVRSGWSLIFGRLLVGWLDSHASGSPPDLIVANPTYVDPGRQGPGHIETIIRQAAAAGYQHRWAFDTMTPTAMIKTATTERSAGQSTTAKRTAAPEVRRVLTVPDPKRTQGRDILVFDDVLPQAANSTRSPTACSPTPSPPASDRSGASPHTMATQVSESPVRSSESFRCRRSSKSAVMKVQR